MVRKLIVIVIAFINTTQYNSVQAPKGGKISASTWSKVCSRQ